MTAVFGNKLRVMADTPGLDIEIAQSRNYQLLTSQAMFYTQRVFRGGGITLIARRYMHPRVSSYNKARAPYIRHGLDVGYTNTCGFGALSAEAVNAICICFQINVWLTYAQLIAPM
jgi:hypothetical protein